MHLIVRSTTTFPNTFSFTSNAATSPGFGMGRHAGGTLFVVGGTDSNGNAVTGDMTLQFWVRTDPGDSTSFRLADGSNAFVSLTVTANRCYALPDALFACPWVIPVAGTAGQTVQARLSLKS